MKKFLVLSAVAVLLGGAAGAVWYFGNSDKRFSKHQHKARILIGQDNLAAARKEFQAAYALRGGYRPTVSEEVVLLEMEILAKDSLRDSALSLGREYLRENPKAGGRAALVHARLLLEAKEFDAAFSLLDRLIRDNPRNVRAREMLAIIRSHQGRFDLAERELRRIVEAQPDSIRTLMLLAANLESQGRTEERRAVALQVLAKDAGNIQANLVVVDTWLKSRNPDSAGKALERWEAADSGSRFQITLRKASLHALGGDYAKAHALLDPLLDGREESVPAYFEKARLFAEQDRFDDAMPLYRQVSDRFPAYASTARTLEVLLLLAGRKPAEALAAIKTLDPGLERSDNLKLALYAFLGMGQDHRAREALEKSRVEDRVRREFAGLLDMAVPKPEFASGLALINYHMLMKNPYLSAKAAQNLFAQFPANDMAASLLADQFRMVGRPDFAYQALAKVRSPTPQQRMTMAALLMAARKPGEAVALLKKLQAEAPRTAGSNLLMADCYQQLGEAEKALQHYLKELEVDSNNVAAMNNVAWQYGVVRQDMTKVGPFLSRLQTRSHSDPRVLDTIGWIYALQGDYPRAEGFLRDAASLVPDNPTVLYHLAFVVHKQGRHQDARRDLEKALESKGPWEGREEAGALLRSLI